MWTILSSPDRFRRFVLLLGCFALAGTLLASCGPEEGVYVVPRATETAQDAPRPVKLVSDDSPPQIDNSQLRTPVELESVVVRRLDAKMAEMAGAKFLEEATDPLIIEVQVQVPFDPLPRASWPVIFLNDERLKNSRMLAGVDDKLVAFLTDRRPIKDVNTVKVAWIGNEELTMTKKSLTFRSEDVGD